MDLIERLHTIGGDGALLFQRAYHWARKCIIWRMPDANGDWIQADTLEALLDAYEQSESEEEQLGDE